MINQPLNIRDQSKILIFALLLATSMVFGVGLIPALFLGVGVFMLKKHKDFSHIETAVKNTKTYIALLLVGCILATIYFGSTYGKPDHMPYDGAYWDNENNFIMFIIFSVIAFSYLILIKALFLNPLKSHSEWIEENGIFSSESKSSGVDIIKCEKLKQYSVSDELLKWAKLKDDGHISEDEFNKARAKILNRKS